MIDETDMAKKILGKEPEKRENVKTVANWLADNIVWNVSKKGCGTVVFTGIMAAAAMTDEDKRKARSGATRIESKNGFVFVRK